MLTSVVDYLEALDQQLFVAGRAAHAREEAAGRVMTERVVGLLSRAQHAIAEATRGAGRAVPHALSGAGEWLHRAAPPPPSAERRPSYATVVEAPPQTAAVAVRLLAGRIVPFARGVVHAAASVPRFVLKTIYNGINGAGRVMSWPLRLALRLPLVSRALLPPQQRQRAATFGKPSGPAGAAPAVEEPQHTLFEAFSADLGAQHLRTDAAQSEARQQRRADSLSQQPTVGGPSMLQLQIPRTRATQHALQEMDDVQRYIDDMRHVMGAASRQPPATGAAAAT